MAGGSAARSPYLPPERIHDFLNSWAQKRSKSDGAQDLWSELENVRKQGYCMHFEPHNESCSLAAPIFDASYTVKAAVSVSCKRHLSIWNDEHTFCEMVKDAAWEVSSKLHYAKGNDSSKTAHSGNAEGSRRLLVPIRPGTRAS